VYVYFKMPLKYKNCSCLYREIRLIFVLSIRSFFLNFDQLLKKDYEFITRPRYLVSRISHGTEYFRLNTKGQKSLLPMKKRAGDDRRCTRKMWLIIKKSWEFAVLKVHKHKIISINFFDLNQILICPIFEKICVSFPSIFVRISKFEHFRGDWAKSSLWSY
jgi:hypothetical protein